MYKVLIADDEIRMRKLVRDFLVRAEYEVVEASNGEEALNKFYGDHSIDLVILDIMMPEIDGYEVCREIRAKSQVPIILLTAKSTENDELEGFQCGADEFVSKPFSPKVLIARVDALLRRANAGNEEGPIAAGKIIVDKVAHMVKADGVAIDLSYKEFELLTYFMENHDIALSRETILNHVWDFDYFGDARTIDTHVKKLRNKLGDCGKYIKTIWGMGYKFEVND